MMLSVAWAFAVAVSRSCAPITDAWWWIERRGDAMIKLPVGLEGNANSQSVIRLLDEELTACQSQSGFQWSDFIPFPRI